MDENKNVRTIDITPEWSGMFRYAEAIVETEIPKDHGQDIVVEMLEYGRRLYEAQKDEVKDNG